MDLMPSSALCSAIITLPSWIIEYVLSQNPSSVRAMCSRNSGDGSCSASVGTICR